MMHIQDLPEVVTSVCSTISNPKTLFRFFPANYHLKFECVDDIEFVAELNKLSHDEVRRRMANDNTVYVAFYKNEAVAFGWRGSGKAFIGELNHEMILPVHHKYLWNFRTMEKFRGLGVYPQLLQHILRSESHSTKCFWILHSPENVASRKGILKAGLQLIAQVSIKNLDRVIVNCFDESDDLRVLGFDPSVEEQATCWMCSSPFLSHKKTGCCCLSQERIVMKNNSNQHRNKNSGSLFVFTVAYKLQFNYEIVLFNIRILAFCLCFLCARIQNHHYCRIYCANGDWQVKNG